MFGMYLNNNGYQDYPSLHSTNSNMVTARSRLVSNLRTLVLRLANGAVPAVWKEVDPISVGAGV